MTDKTTTAPARCFLCAAGNKPVKMKRQYVHHVRRTGRIVVCEKAALKPASA